jgi:hypothetical protein
VFLNEEEWNLIVNVYDRIYHSILDVFQIKQAATLKLSSPSFFSRIDSNNPVTDHDDYTHVHVDADQYGTFCYTGLVYLSDGDGVDFDGGEFVWLDQASTPEAQAQHQSNEKQISNHPLARFKTIEHVVTPRKARLSLFTSGNENLHHVRKVTGGLRRALTVAFTCEQMDDDAIGQKLMSGGGVHDLLKTAWKGL